MSVSDFSIYVLNIQPYFIQVSSSDNKTATYALMDKNAFGRERYRLGHTLVFFRAGALAYLEELRDELVVKWVRMIQGEVLKRVRGRVFGKKRDQRWAHI